MRKMGLYIAKIKGKLLGSHEPVNEYYRRGGVKIGEKCLICSSPLTKEPYLVEIGDNVTISINVSFVTHDNSVKLLISNSSDCFGKIKIGDNCFIGQNSVLLYGVTLGNNIIVAAGSVVTKSFTESNIIIGGNPARIIGNWDTFQNKIADKAIRRNDLKERLQKDDSFLVKR